MAPSKKKKNNNNSSPSSRLKTLAEEILIDQNRILIENNKRLEQEIENLKQQLMEKTTVDQRGFQLKLPRVVLNQPNVMFENNLIYDILKDNEP
ncbi:unnamed protein product [Adineta ricciae]|uniref:Uncharacterized protein n=1 Tax=Adineta ricciae TaxID=249248 RepID=A0A815XH53_ADIRI|nr:unnamed protein product [Adineta ricciae]CAF1557613.1 unnamed protein product [Adineta ricciae]